MNLYERNLDVMKECRKSLYDGILNYEKDRKSYNDIQISSAPTKDGNSTITLHWKDRVYRLNSMYQPINEAEKWALSFKYQNIENVTSMFGLGNGIFLRELMKKKNEEDKILVYEPCPEILIHVLKNYDITDILSDEKIVVAVVGMNEQIFKLELEQVVTWSNVETQIVCLHPQYEKIFLESLKNFLTIISENNNGILINRNTVAYFSRDVIGNTLKNLRYIKESNTVLDLKGEIPQDIPAIIISAGPSLDKNINLLKQAKGKAVIVATDTAMKFLYKHDIVPDFCVTLDAMKPPSYMDDPRFMDVPMFAKIESNWKILRRHRARKIFYNCQDYMNRLYEKVGKRISFYESGGSVATGAFSICAALGFKKIVLIGQDLAYEGDRTHAGTLVDRIRGEELGVRYVEGIYGGKVKTRHDWYLYLKWLEHAIEEVKSFITVIDATEGGAKIHGSVIMTLQEVIDQYCTQEVNCEEIIRKKSPTLSGEESEKIYKYMQSNLEDFESIHQNAQKAQRLCEQILDKLKNNTEFSDKLLIKAQEISKINEEIEKNMVFSLINEYAAELTMHVLKDIYKFTESEEENRISTFKRAKSFYEAIISSVTAMKPMLEEAVNDFWATDHEVVKNETNRTVVIMQTGVGKTDLNEKIMKRMFGRTMLDHNIERILQSKQIDDIVIVASIYEEDDDIVREAQRLNIKTFRGNQNDVLGAYYYAAKENRADTIVRVNFECPLVDPHIIDKAVECYQNTECDLVTNTGMNEDRTYAKGLEVEVFSMDILLEAYRLGKETYQRQQVMSYIYEKGSICQLKNDVDSSDYNLTLGTEESVEIINMLYQNLYHGEHNFYQNEVIDFLRRG